MLLNGSNAGQLTTYPNKVTSSCDEGFLLRGSAVRFCQANRTWSGNQTICEGNVYLSSCPSKSVVTMSSRIVKSVLKRLLLHHRISHFQVSLLVQKQPVSLLDLVLS